MFPQMMGMGMGMPAAPSQLDLARLQQLLQAAKQRQAPQQTLAQPIAAPPVTSSTSTPPPTNMNWADMATAGAEAGKALGGQLFGTFPGRPGTADAFAAAKGKMFPGLFSLFQSGGLY